MVELIQGLSVGCVRLNLERVRAQIAAAGRDPDEVEILAAVKYVPIGDLGALAEAGLTLLGENRAQDLLAKQAAYPDRFTWDFIGNLQSRKVRQILPHVRLIHSVASESVLSALARHGDERTRVLIEVNVADEPGKGGVPPSELDGFLARCPVTVAGLMTMPPAARTPEDSRPHFAALRELAQRHGLAQLSMGTSQDYVVAAQEGATIIRLGTSLYVGAP
jgi:PLP dependent protein